MAGQRVRISRAKFFKIRASFPDNPVLFNFSDGARQAGATLPNGVKVEIETTKTHLGHQRTSYFIIQQADQRETFFDTVRRAGGLQGGHGIKFMV